MAKPGRNDLCHCGSGKKYKKCHESKETGKARGRVLVMIVGAAMVAAVAAAVVTFTGEGASSGTRVWDPAHGHYHDANGVEVP
ncbi:MAG: SEC-C metal-binding domain-containing protein [Vicinamibacterales bacterium]